MRPCCYPFCDKAAVQFLVWRPLHQPERWRSECRCEEHRARGDELGAWFINGTQELSLEELEGWEAARDVHDA